MTTLLDRPRVVGRFDPAERTSPTDAMAALTEFALVVLLLLMPVQFLELPLNFSVVELWSAAMIAVIWLDVLVNHRPIWLPYLVPMWLVFLASLVATVVTPDAIVSLLVVVKEGYLYLWFLSIVAGMAALDARARRRVLSVWLTVVLLHALFLISQFVFPSLFTASRDFLSGSGEVDQWRPSGLFKNANSAAFYQLMGLTPLFLLSRTGRQLGLGLLVIVLGILATGSMGALSALLAGTVASLALAALFARRPRTVRRWVTSGTVGLLGLVAAGVALLSARPDLVTQIEELIFGRAGRSAGGRLELWHEALELFSRSSYVGIGPDGFTVLSERETFVHNDLLAFIVERGFLGGLALVILGVAALLKAARVLRESIRSVDTPATAGLVFVGLTVAVIVYSQTHQIFRARSMWLMLAMLEVHLFTMLSGASVLSGASTSSRQPISANRATVAGQSVAGETGLPPGEHVSEFSAGPPLEAPQRVG